MNFAIECCCSRKSTKQHKMKPIKKEEIYAEQCLSDIYELVLTPCETNVDMPETPKNLLQVDLQEKKRNIYVNFFEDSNTPTTPRTPDVNENVINVPITKGSNIYVNYQHFDFT
jgi:hypothetical protein